MNLNNVKLVVSAVNPSQYPNKNYPEIAFVGRSNVGKSSLINKILNRKNFARVSSKPGKTATINFYDIDSSVYLVDLPGYGYAKVSKQEKLKWAEMIETYLESRKNLKNIIILVDSRHLPSEDDMVMLNWIKYFNKNYYVVATKTDKNKKSELEEKLRQIREVLKIDDHRFIPFSSITGEGREDVLKIIENAF